MKKNLLFILIFCITIKCYSESDKISYCKAIDNHINIRTEPNTNCKVLGQLFEDDVIKIYENKSLTDWYYCYIPKISDYGYCFKEYFEEYKPWFFEIISFLIQNDNFYYEMIINKNVKACPSNLVFLKNFDNCSEEVVYKILKIGIDNKLIYNSRNGGTTILSEIVIRNFNNITEYLLKETDEIKEINEVYTSYYGPPILFSVCNGNLEITELLLQYGADPNGKARNGQKMFYWIEDQINQGEYSEEIGKKLKNILLKYGYVE